MPTRAQTRPNSSKTTRTNKTRLRPLDEQNGDHRSHPLRNKRLATKCLDNSSRAVIRLCTSAQVCSPESRASRPLARRDMLDSGRLFENLLARARPTPGHSRSPTEESRPLAREQPIDTGLAHGPHPLRIRGYARLDSDSGGDALTRAQPGRTLATPDGVNRCDAPATGDWSPPHSGRRVPVEAHGDRGNRLDRQWKFRAANSCDARAQRSIKKLKSRIQERLVLEARAGTTR